MTTTSPPRPATQAADRQRRGVALCSCGGEYIPTPDGRRAHRLLQGHTPSPAPEGGVR